MHHAQWTPPFLEPIYHPKACVWLRHLSDRLLVHMKWYFTLPWKKIHFSDMHSSISVRLSTLDLAKNDRMSFMVCLIEH